MADMTETIGIAMVGAGAFGQFCLKAFSEVQGIKIAAVVDTDLERAQAVASAYDAAAYQDLDSALGRPDVAIVILSTPPYLHAEQGLAALRSGKHLFCEKPLALTVEDGQRMIAEAQANHVHLTVNYVMRHNPYWQAAAQIAQSKVLGALLHMDLQNHAAGLALSDQHWFWDKKLSGGIWIEHGVHFFDAFSWVSGLQGTVLGSTQYFRADGAVDRVEALMRYGNTAAHCYHAFDQSKQTEQTTVRLTFEQGYITLREWVPTSLELLTTVERIHWESFMPGSVTSQTLPTGQLEVVARLQDDKAAIYIRGIQSGMRDLVDALRNPQHMVAVRAEYGLDSLKMAVAAEDMGSH
jgi:predicted dehydrogenase